jgi:hypothetical protein
MKSTVLQVALIGLSFALPMGAAHAASWVCHLTDPGKRRTYLGEHNTEKEAAKAARSEFFDDGPMRCVNTSELERADPFKGFQMKPYLDAIYKNDLVRVKQLDQQYLGQVVAQTRAGMGDLFGKKSADAMQMESASLIVPAMGTYTQYYGNWYADCLRKDYQQFMLTVSRYDPRSGTNKVKETTYRLNTEFVSAFKATMDVNPSPTFGPFTDINAGVAQVIGKYSCTDPILKQFESNLLKIYNAITPNSATK